MSVELRYMPCAEFEGVIHAFVDGESNQAEARSLVVHLELCDGCRDSVDALRTQIRAHQDGRDVREIHATFDKNAFFKRLSGNLYTSNVQRLGGLLYELGKAYFVAGNDSKLMTLLHRKAVPVERARTESRRLVRETVSLAERAGTGGRKQALALRRSERLLRGQRSSKAGRIGFRSGRGALDNARLFLEECLILEPRHAQARLYLGVYFHRIGRVEEAMAEYRKVLAIPQLDSPMRAMALQALGNAYNSQRDYQKALDCYEEILASGIAREDSRFFTVLLCVGMFHAKLGRFDRSTVVFGELVRDFPQRLEEARAFLEQADVFRSLLVQQKRFHSDLLQRYPVLFAG